MRLVQPSPRRTCRPRSGAAAVELALVVPVLVFLCLGIVDFARLLYYYEIIATCAENGTLYACDPASQTSSPYYNVSIATGTSNAALADASTLSPAPTVDAPQYGATGASGSFSTTTLTSGYVQVTVHHQFSVLILYPGITQQNWSSTITVSRSAVMRIVPAS